MNDTRLRGKLKKNDLPGYQVLRKDKPLVGATATAGGVAFAIPCRWSCLEYEFKTKEDHLEALAATLFPPDSKPFKLATCYNHLSNVFLLSEHSGTEVKFPSKVS